MKLLTPNRLRDLPLEVLLREIRDRRERKLQPYRVGEAPTVTVLDFLYLSELVLRLYEEDRES